MAEEEPEFATDRALCLIVAILDELVAAASCLDVALPRRQITGVGAIPHDCDQVYVTLMQITTGLPEGSGGRSAAGTYPNSGSNMTAYQATVTLAIVRATTEVPQGGPNSTNAPAPATYLKNLTTASTDVAILVKAINAVQNKMSMTAIPRTITTAPPGGGVFATSARITVTV